MLRIFRGLARLKLFDKRETDPDSIREERWSADFSRPRKARFTATDEASYETFFQDGAYALRLKKGECLAWAQDPQFRYTDLVAEATIRFAEPMPSATAYAAAGLLFRCADEDSYYSVLISTKGYFRIDAVFNRTPMPLVGWTELPTPERPFKSNVDAWRLRVIALSDRITVTINDAWAAEVVDGTLSSGRIAFAVASYDSVSGVTARLESLKIDSRPIEVEASQLRWNSLIRVGSDARMRLAETFAAMGQPMSALVQFKRAGTGRSQAELLLAADCAMRLSLTREAEDYLESCIEIDPDSEEARRAVAEKAKILYMDGRYAELKDHAEEAIVLFPSDATLRALLGHAYWNLGAAEKAAAAYDAALALESGNGLIARNAAQAYEKLGNRDRAYERYLTAGRAFLAAEDYAELAIVEPRLLDLRGDDPASHALAGKRAFALEDWKRAETELDLTAKLQAARNAKGENQAEAEDPAVPYLRALLLTRSGKRKAALPLLEHAVRLEGDYAPFRFRLAECRFLLTHDPHDPKLIADLSVALRLAPEDGWIANFAAQVALSRGDLLEAARHLERAFAALPTEPSVLANRAELAFLRGDAEAALALLAEGAIADPEGVLATERGNLLVRLARYEEADEAYARALRSSPADAEYLRNRASCLIELSRFGEADELLAKAFEADPSPRTLELTAYVAAKKGELPRAEAACRLALELDPEDTAILASLAWTYLAMSRWKSAEETIARLEAAAKPDTAAAAGAAELRERLLEATTRKVSCASCGRTWRVAKDAPSSPALRLVAEPPDDFPAGTCPTCLKTYCIACAKSHMVDGRFACPADGGRLKLLDEGLKKLLADWAARAAADQKAAD